MNKDIVGAVFPEEIKRVKEGRCATCGKPIRLGEFRDTLSIKEYAISGMCMDCQIKTFGIDQ